MIDLQKDILSFWFDETQPAQWFQADSGFDEAIRARFEDAYAKGAGGELKDWRNSAEGCLALCLLLDQFSRNMYRGTPKAFATDEQALAVAEEAITKGFDRSLPPHKRRFLYLPYEHSENLADQQKSVALFSTMKDDDPLGYDYALRHLEVIEKFGRFPHRNGILGRMNTPEEEEYLAQPGAGF